MPDVGESFQQSVDDGSLSRQPEGLQIQAQGLVDTQPLEAKRAAQDECNSSNISLFGTSQMSLSKRSRFFSNVCVNPFLFFFIVFCDQKMAEAVTPPPSPLT